MTIGYAVEKYNSIKHEITRAREIRRIIHDAETISTERQRLTIQQVTGLKYMIDYYIDERKRELDQEFHQTFEEDGTTTDNLPEKIIVQYEDQGFGVCEISGDCPKCKELIKYRFHPKFCGYCGTPVKWELD